MNSLRAKLVASFLAFNLFFVVLAIAVFWLLKKVETAQEFKTNIHHTQLNVFHLLQAEALFSQYDAIDSTFFIHQDSPNKQRYERTLNAIRATLLSDKMQSESIGIDISIQIKELLQLLNEHERVFKMFTQKIYNRGFKDYGLEGEMRDHAHVLMDIDKSVLSESSILMLRRHEKDYFLRKDEAYLLKFNQLVIQLQNLLDFKQVKGADSIQKHLKIYQEDLNEIALLEQELGYSNNLGLRGDLSLLNHELNAIIEEINQLAEAKSKERFSYIISVFVATLLAGLLLSFVAAYFLARLIAKPIQQLANEINAIQKESLAQKVELVAYSKTKEIQRLTTSFNNMLKIIHQQIEEITLQKNQLKKQNAELANSEQKLLESNSVKDKFFSILAHDLKTPLGNIANYLSLINNDIDLYSKQELKKISAQYLKSVNQVSALLESLLQWAQNQLGNQQFNPQNIQLNTVINECIQLYKPTAEAKGVSILYNQNIQFQAFADVNMVKLIIRNLLANAIKYSFENSTIYIQLFPQGSFVEVNITDEGVGMSEKQQKNLFKLQSGSVKGTKNESGNGLGLLLCKEFIEFHNGKITVVSEPNKGTTIKFTIPVNQLVLSTKQTLVLAV